MESERKLPEGEPMDLGGEEEGREGSSSIEGSSSMEGSGQQHLLTREGSSSMEEAGHGLDLNRTATDYAQYLVVNSKQDVSHQ